MNIIYCAYGDKSVYILLKLRLTFPIFQTPPPLIALVELYYNTYSALFFFPKYLLVSPNGKSTSESFNSK